MAIKAIVIAEYYKQYNQWIKQEGKNPREYKYVHSEEQLLGLHKIPIIYVGGFWNSPVYYSDYLKML